MAATGRNTIFRKIDAVSLIRDLLRSLWAVVLGALAVYMITDMVMHKGYEATYTTNTTLVIMSKSSSNYVYSNLSAAQNMVEGFNNILNSDVLKNKVCEDIGIDRFWGEAKASVIDETNLISLEVTSQTPQLAFLIIQSIIRN